MNDAHVLPGNPAARLDTLNGKRIALLDITKPGGSVFLDRLEHLLTTRFHGGEVIRTQKATYTKPAPQDVLDSLRGVDAFIEALAD